MSEALAPRLSNGGALGYATRLEFRINPVCKLIIVYASPLKQYNVTHKLTRAHINTRTPAHPHMQRDR